MASPDERESLDGVAIVGMSARVPGASNVAAFWTNLRNGVESISRFSDEELLAAGVDPALLREPGYVRARGALDDIDLFDASFFGINPREAEYMDPQHRVFLEAAWECLEHAGYDPERCKGSIGVFAGLGMNMYLLFNLASHRDFLARIGGVQLMIGNDKDHLSTRVSYKLNLRGPSLTLQTACSTSLVAVCQACENLLTHQCDMALAGGVSLSVPERSGYLYREGGIASPDGHCRAFDAQARGTVGGSGLGIVLLKRLEDALADGDCVHAVIKGFAVNNDGSGKIGYTAPSIDGQADVIAMAHAMADVGAGTISYVETHGTGTPLGDPIELAALTKAFRTSTDATSCCAIGSVKTNIGHLDAAAGVAGLIKTTLALEHRLLPPSLHFERAHPDVDLARTPFYVNARLAEWSGPTPRRAGVSSFGIGGTNAHVVLEEAPRVDSAGHSRRPRLLPLSARTPSALGSTATNLLAHLRAYPDLDLADAAYTLQVGRKAFAWRAIVIAADVDEAVSALEHRTSGRVYTATAAAGAPSVVFMFPGQGSQHVRMAQTLYESEPAFRHEVDLACDLLAPVAGFDLRSVLYPPEPDEDASSDQLRQTFTAQPALFVVEYALAKLWLEWGIRPAALIGHSVGEYVAACLAGVFSVADALRLVALRGQLVQRLPEGVMLSVALSEADVQPLLHGMEIAADNAPDATVLAGTSEDARRCALELAQRGIACRSLKTSHAFHSRMMDPVLDAFAAEVARVERRAPAIPYISNVTGTWITPDQATDPWFWARHLRQTVRFSDGIRTLLATPDRVLLEVGPGQMLTMLARRQRQAGETPVALPSLPQPNEQRSATETMVTTLGRLWLAGAQPDWVRFHGHGRRRRVVLPTYPFERQRYWIEAATGDGHSGATGNRRLSVDDWFSIPVWKRTVPPALLPRSNLAAQASANLLFCDADGLAAQLADRLTGDGCDVVRVFRGDAFTRRSAQEYTINPSDRNHYAALLEALHVEGRTPGRVVHLWATESDAELSFNDVQERTFYSLLFLTQAWSASASTLPLALFAISTGLHQVIGDEALDPAKATLLGVCQVIAQEHPGIRCRVIDIDREGGAPDGARAIDQVVSELRADSPDPVVAYRNGYRWVRNFERLQSDPETKQQSRLRNGGVYLITGGLGDLGHACAEYIARRVSAHLVLVGRSALPDRTAWDEQLGSADAADRVRERIRRVRSLEDLARSVTVETADVADLDQMAAVVARAFDRWGRIDGVVHAAGLTTADAFGPIAALTRESCDRHFAPKAMGVFVLDEVLRAQPPDFYLLFSSLSAVLGGLHLGAYAAANCFMDAFATARHRSEGSRWISVNWDAWRADSDEANAATDRSSVRLPAILLSEAPDVFDRVFDVGPVPQIVVSTTDLQARIEQWVTTPPGARRATDDAPPEARHQRPALSLAYVPPGTDVEERIAALWSELLGVDRVGLRDNFFELGGHSLLAIQLLSRLRDAFRVELPVHALFDKPTVGELAAAVGQASGAATDEERNVAALIDLVEDLPDDDVARLLANQAVASGKSAALADPGKERTRQFYDDVNRELNASPAGGFAEFLNFGYVAENPLAPEAARQASRVLNESYIRLVTEVIGDCALENARVLDVGCGRGGAVRMMATRFGARYVIGVDLSSAAIAYCRTRHNGIRAVFLNADAEHLPFADRCFDVVTSIESSHSYADVAGFYHEVRRLLRDDGHFLYADLFPSDALESLQDRLAEAGFVLDDDRDVTRQVVSACEQRATRHLELMKGARNAETMRDFLGAPGSQPYEDMVAGRASYHVIRLRAPFVESTRARTPRAS